MNNKRKRKKREIKEIETHSNMQKYEGGSSS
jgi:hypothetical protein